MKLNDLQTLSQLNPVKISNTCAFSSFIFSHVTSSYTTVSSVVFDTLLLSAFSKIKEKVPKPVLRLIVPIQNYPCLFFSRNAFVRMDNAKRRKLSFNEDSCCF